MRKTTRCKSKKWRIRSYCPLCYTNDAHICYCLLTISIRSYNSFLWSHCTKKKVKIFDAYTMSKEDNLDVLLNCLYRLSSVGKASGLSSNLPGAFVRIYWIEFLNIIIFHPKIFFRSFDFKNIYFLCIMLSVIIR